MLRFELLRTRRVAGVACGTLLLLTAHAALAQVNAPIFSKNYFVTGDYVVAGVGLKGTGGADGFANGVITIPESAVPAGGEPLAAFLYWASVVPQSDLGGGLDGAQFEDHTIANFTKIINPQGTSPCWSSGGATGSPDGSRSMMVHRADVLRFLHRDQNGRLVASGTFKVKLPDSGNGNQVVFTLGASLVVIYRTPEGPNAPLRSVVLYEGGFVFDQKHDLIGPTTLEGFYEAAKTSPKAKLSVIAGNGSSGFSEQLLFNNQPLSSNPSNPFQGTATPDGSGPTDTGWDNRTFDVSAWMVADSSSATVSITHNTANFDCLSGGVFILSTTVEDNDGDGLIDRIEDSKTTLKTPQGEDLPNLYNMNGGNTGSDQKDLYIEIGALVANSTNPYGAHNHLPSPDVLKLMGDAFRDAPNNQAIRVHFDMGPNYNPKSSTADASAYVITSAQGAKGGRTIKEVACDSTKVKCQFPGYPGTVSWKMGFQFYRDAPVDSNGNELDGPAEDACLGVAPSTVVSYKVGTKTFTVTCGGPRFDPARKDIFRYALFAHWRGVPKSPFPCIDKSTSPATLTVKGYVNGACVAPYVDNAEFHIPTSSSGVADLPGGDALITLGAWDNLRGSDFVQASTLMHELGHTFWRGHGGDAMSVQANCKPNYQSVMSYLFQLRGLLDDNGVAHLDYSSTPEDSLIENQLSDTTPVTSSSYRAAWFAPAGPGTTAAALGLVPAKRYCDGRLYTGATQALVRVDNPLSSASIDWALDGIGTAIPQDIDFNGVGPETLTGSADWGKLQLQQIGARHSMAGFSVGVGFAHGVGIDFGGGVGIDFGGGVGIDFGGGVGIDFGGGVGIDFGGGASCGAGIDCGNGIDAGVGIDFGGGIELDADIAAGLGNSPPNELTACIIGTAGCTGASNGSDLHRTKLTWKAPHAGTVVGYKVFRLYGTGTNVTLANAADVARVQGDIVQSGNMFTLVDRQELPDYIVGGNSFSYYVLAQFTNNVTSSPSNYATIQAIDVAPVGTADSYSVAKNGTLTITAPATSSDKDTRLLANDKDVDSAPAILRTVLPAAPFRTLHGTVTSWGGDGSFTYVPDAKYTGPDSFTYTLNDGTFSFVAADGNTRNTTIVMSADSTPPTLVSITVTNK